MSPAPLREQRRIMVEGVSRDGSTPEGGNLFHRDRMAAIVTVENLTLDDIAAIREGNNPATVDIRELEIRQEIGQVVLDRLLAEREPPDPPAAA